MTKRLARSLVGRFGGTLLGLSLLPVLAVGVTAVFLSSTALEREAGRRMAETLLRERDLLDSQLSIIRALAAKLASVDELANALALDPANTDAYDRLATRAKVGYILNGYNTIGGLASIDLFGAAGQSFHVGGTLLAPRFSSGSRHKLYQAGLNSGGQLVWMGVEPNPNLDSKETLILPAVRAVQGYGLQQAGHSQREAPALQTVGVVSINLSTRQLAERMAAVDLGQGGIFMVIDQKGRLIFHTDQGRVGQAADTAFLMEQGGGGRAVRMVWQNEAYRAVDAGLQEAPWRLVALAPEKELFRDSANIQTLTMIVTGLVLALAFVGAWRFSRRVAQPIQDVAAAFRDLEDGKLAPETRLDVKGEGEVADLARGFNALMAWRDARDEAERGLIRAKEEAEAANRFKSEFLANFSHELRTPLNAIVGFAQMMTQRIFGPLGDPHYDDYAQDIEHSGKLLTSVIGDLIDLSKIELGRLELDIDQVKPDDVIDRALRVLSPKARDAGIAIEREPLSEGQKDVSVLADHTALTRIVLNIVGNAIKFTPNGGSIHIAIAADTDTVTFRISDTGIGIPQDQLDKVLEPFHQVGGASLRNVEGTGLGLAIVAALAGAMGGSVHLTSQLGKGTTVTTTLPRWTGQRPDQPSSISHKNENLNK